MRIVILPFLFLFVTSLFSSETTRQEYQQLIQQYPHLVEHKGSFAKGEIEIVLDPARMSTIEVAASRDVGVIARDRYWIWINDACVFPNGRTGVYGRMLWIKGLESPQAGVVVMPVLPDGRIVLNCNYRHATRSWEIELPRGAVDPGETPEAAARRETVEETGMVAGSLTLLGTIPPDSGMAGTLAPVYLATVIGKQDVDQEDTEAIEEIIALKPEEIKTAFLQGFYDINLRGESKRVEFRDPFLSYAFLQYLLRK